jgi:L-threonylcarbamoyladenylate synthase
VYFDRLVTEVFKVDRDAPDPAVILRAADCLRNGGLVAFPTETVYGLGASALNRQAVCRLFAAKNRPATDPLIVHIASAAQLDAVTEGAPTVVEQLAARFWPGPLTLVLRRHPLVPDEVTAHLDTVAVRIPSHPVARALLAAAAIPIAAPSANTFSRPSPTTAAHVLHDLDSRIDMVLDSGPTELGVESTVLDMTAPQPTVLRPGAITAEMLREVLGEVTFYRAPATESTTHAQASPGMFPRHYSPRTPLTLYEGERDAVLARIAKDARSHAARGNRVGLLVFTEDLSDVALDAAGIDVRALGSVRNTPEVAARLYATLRELDAAGVHHILVRGISDASGLGAAIQDRLRRAAAGAIVTCGPHS